MFRFKFQALLDYRKQLEGQILTEMSHIERDLRREKEKLSLLERRRAAVQNELQNESDDEHSVMDIEVFYRYIKRLRADEILRMENMNVLKEELSRKRQGLMEMVKKRKMLEILREKQLRKFSIAENARERKELDEVGILQNSRV